MKPNTDKLKKMIIKEMMDYDSMPSPESPMSQLNPADMQGRDELDLEKGLKSLLNNSDIGNEVRECIIIVKKDLKIGQRMAKNY